MRQRGAASVANQWFSYISVAAASTVNITTMVVAAILAILPYFGCFLKKGEPRQKLTLDQEVIAVQRNPVGEGKAARASDVVGW